MFKGKEAQILFWVPQATSLAKGQRAGRCGLASLLLAEGPLVIPVTSASEIGQTAAANSSPSDPALLPFSLASILCTRALSCHWYIFNTVTRLRMQSQIHKLPLTRVSFFSARFTSLSHSPTLGPHHLLPAPL